MGVGEEFLGLRQFAHRDSEFGIAEVGFKLIHVFPPLLEGIVRCVFFGGVRSGGIDDRIPGLQVAASGHVGAADIFFLGEVPAGGRPEGVGLPGEFLILEGISDFVVHFAS